MTEVISGRSIQSWEFPAGQLHPTASAAHCAHSGKLGSLLLRFGRRPSTCFAPLRDHRFEVKLNGALHSSWRVCPAR